MRTGSKILFIEDEINLDNKIIGCLEAARLISGDISDREELNESTDGNIVIATSFTDAFEKIISLGDGSEYEWIFIDRNLAEYAISSEETIILRDYITSKLEDFFIGDQIFTKKFFNGLIQEYSNTGEQRIFAGDYLFIMLINAGVPIEKICFLTANNDASMEELTKSPYLHKKRLPEVISKDSDGYKKLEEKLRDSHGAKVRFLYREIFNNEKVKNVFGSYIEQFISVLAKRYKYGSNATYTKGDGILLRNMIEMGIPQIVPEEYSKKTIRKFLNCANAKYNTKPKDYAPTEEEKKLHNIWIKMLNESVKIGEKNSLLWTDKKDLENRFGKIEKKGEICLDNVINYDTARFLTALNLLYFGEPPSDLPPKYIFSYIDNIYTVTSEFSAHGKNDKTTDGLSLDGWSALLSGMLQIMQWVTDTNP